MMQTPDEIVGMASEYLHIYFLGMIPQMIYNMGEGTFRKFKGTIKSITEHDIPGAVMGLKSSLWHRQLPARSGRLIKEFEKG